MPKSTLNHRVANRTEKHGENTTDQKLSVEHTQGLYDYWTHQKLSWYTLMVFMLIDLFFMWLIFHWNRILLIKNIFFRTKRKIAHVTFEVLSILVNQYVRLYIMSFGGDKNWCVAVFKETDSDCSSPIDIDDTLQNAEWKT